jgi:hypothetical protein
MNAFQIHRRPRSTVRTYWDPPSGSWSLSRTSSRGNRSCRLCQAGRLWMMRSPFRNVYIIPFAPARLNQTSSNMIKMKGIMKIEMEMVILIG